MTIKKAVIDLDTVCANHIYGKIYDLDFSRDLIEALILERIGLKEKLRIITSGIYKLETSQEEEEHDGE